MSDIKNKTPRTVEVKLLIPYGLLVAAIIAFSGVALGWNLHVQADNDAKARANEMVTSLVKKEQK